MLGSVTDGDGAADLLCQKEEPKRDEKHRADGRQTLHECPTWPFSTVATFYPYRGDISRDGSCVASSPHPTDPLSLNASGSSPGFLRSSPSEARQTRESGLDAKPARRTPGQANNLRTGQGLC